MPKYEAKLTDGPILSTLLTMAAGMLIGFISMVIFNLTDTFFVAKLGTVALAAMSFTFPVIMFMGAIMMGLGVGTGALISRFIGQGKTRLVRLSTTSTYLLAILLGTAIAGTVALLIKPILIAMGAQGETLSLSTKYLYIILLFFPIGTIPMVCNNAIRATGETRIPGIIMATSALINMVLDPFFIFGIWIFPEWGMVGAATATVVARLISMTLSTLVLRKLKMLKFGRLRLKSVLLVWRRLLLLGIPAAITQLMIPLSVAVFTGLVARYGNAAVAALGTGSRINMFAVMPLMSLGSVFLPFVGQNYGAHNLERIKKAYTLSTMMAFVWSVFICSVIFVFAYPLSLIFSNDPDVITRLVSYLHIIPFSYMFMGITIFGSQSLNALHLPLHSSFIQFLRAFILSIPLALIFERFLGYDGLLLGLVAGSAATAVVAHVIFNKKLTELFR